MIRILTIFLFFTNLLFSNVALKSPSSFILGEPLQFSIEYSGAQEPTFPKIEKIDGFRVASAGRTNQISIINGQRSQNISQKYVLYPNKDITIPAFEVVTATKSFKTDPKKVIINKPSKSTSKEFDLNLSVDKKSLFVGESLILTLKFKYRLGLDILNMELNQPNFDGFWAKSLGKSQRAVESGYETHTLKYLLFPQRQGTLDLDPVSINIALPDNTMGAYSLFRKPAKIKRFYSNSVNLEVKPLPNNLKLIGDYKIEANVDKTKVKLGDAVSFKVEINGSGNLDDIEDIKLDIPSATIYENKPIKKFEFKDGKYKGVYTKSFSIVTNSSFSIKPIEIEYFDLDKKMIKKIQTKRFDIELVGQKQIAKDVILEKAKSQDTTIKKNVVVKPTSNKDKAIFFIFGLICGGLLIFILYYFKNLKKEKKELDKPLIKVAKSSPSKNELLKVLAPYLGKNSELDSLIYLLEDIKEDQFKNIKKDIVVKLKKLNF